MCATAVVCVLRTERAFVMAAHTVPLARIHALVVSRTHALTMEFARYWERARAFPAAKLVILAGKIVVYAVSITVGLFATFPAIPFTAPWSEQRAFVRVATWAPAAQPTAPEIPRTLFALAMGCATKPTMAKHFAHAKQSGTELIVRCTARPRFVRTMASFALSVIVPRVSVNAKSRSLGDSQGRCVRPVRMVTGVPSVIFLVSAVDMEAASKTQEHASATSRRA